MIERYEIFQTFSETISDHRVRVIKSSWDTNYSSGWSFVGHVTGKAIFIERTF